MYYRQKLPVAVPLFKLDLLKAPQQLPCGALCISIVVFTTQSRFHHTFITTAEMTPRRGGRALVGNSQSDTPKTHFRSYSGFRIFLLIGRLQRCRGVGVGGGGAEAATCVRELEGELCGKGETEVK